MVTFSVTLFGGVFQSKFTRMTQSYTLLLKQAPLLSEKLLR